MLLSTLAALTLSANGVCYPLGPVSEPGYQVEFDDDGDTSYDVLVSRLGISGVEKSYAFFKAPHRDDAGLHYDLESPDGKLQLDVTDEFDGEFYAGRLKGDLDGRAVDQELACELTGD